MPPPAPPHLLPAVARQTTQSELTALYVVAITLIVILCIACGLLRNRRLVRSFDAARRATPGPARPPRVAARAPQIVKVRVPPAQLDAPCPICLEPLSPHDATAGHCHHPIHAHCLSQWLARDPHVSCPVCRATYQTVNPPKSDDVPVSAASHMATDAGTRDYSSVDLDTDSAPSEHVSVVNSDVLSLPPAEPQPSPSPRRPCTCAVHQQPAPQPTSPSPSSHHLS